MSSEFYGPKINAEIVINQLLRLPATGNEQDWEFELADATKIDEMIDVFLSSNLDLDCKSALALLIISSMEEADQACTLDDAQIVRMSQLLANDNEVRNRMHFYWIEQEKTSNITLVNRILTKT